MTRDVSLQYGGFFTFDLDLKDIPDIKLTPINPFTLNIPTEGMIRLTNHLVFGKPMIPVDDL